MLAGGYIALRVMRQNHTFVVACYVNLTLMIVSFFTVLFAPGLSFGFVTSLSWQSWCLFLLATVCTVSD